jgi:uroporphyrinogen-III synthase
VESIDKPGVLITRPLDQIEDVSTLIEQQGAHAVPFPLLDIVPISHQGKADRLILDADQYSLSIFISRNAVRFGVPCLKGLWQALPRHMLWIGVGRSTADEMAQHAISGTFPGLASTEGVLSMEETRRVKNKRVLIIRGQGGRERLATTLRARGAEVDYLEVYRRERHPWTHEQLMHRLAAERIQAVIVTSGEALAHFDELLGKASVGRSLTLFLPSARLIDLARKLGFDRVRLTDGADKRAMAGELARWMSEQPQEKL